MINNAASKPVKSKWSKISVNKDLTNRIKQLISENPSLGYNSLSDFIQEAIRKRLEEITYLKRYNKNNREGTVFKDLSKKVLPSNNAGPP